MKLFVFFLFCVTIFWYFVCLAMKKLVCENEDLNMSLIDRIFR